MIASLPMYDLPELRWATNALWQALAERLGVDLELSRDAEFKGAWRDPDLVFSQTCGYPFTHEFSGQLTYVATPHYAADGCEGPLYCSILLARSAAPLQSFRHQTAAFNAADSMSGQLALRLAFAPFAEEGEFFAAACETGSHIGSMAAVQKGEADVCAIDCVTLALVRRYRPAACAGLVEIGRSPQVPGLPYVTRAWRQNIVRSALSDVFMNPGLADARAALLLSGFSNLPETAYDIIPKLELSLG